jgi:agmatine/peptidylarginine deiminase
MAATDTPRSLGFRMPGEFEPHAGAYGKRARPSRVTNTRWNHASPHLPQLPCHEPPLQASHAHITSRFRLPAGTWMAFPYEPYLWRDKAGPAQAAWAGVATAIARFEPVYMTAAPQVE